MSIIINKPARGSLVDATLDDKLAAIEPMIVDGCTVDAALNHVEGMCDVELCCAGDELVADVMALVDTYADAYAAYTAACDASVLDGIDGLARAAAHARTVLHTAIAESVAR
jgi:hypothetical protein